MTTAYLKQREQLIAVSVTLLEGHDGAERSRGLLGRSILAEKTVGIVGLGSGGSTVASVMAASGARDFRLIDYDLLEPGNICRHACGYEDVGRRKTQAVRDLILRKNPGANVETLDADVNADRDVALQFLAGVDLNFCATDTNRSRLNCNTIALETGTTTIFGRVTSRAAGGDVLRVRPLDGPCLACLYDTGVSRPEDQEISNRDRAAAQLPAYVSPDDVAAVVQVGLINDITPITTMMVRLALLELTRGSGGLDSLDEDLTSHLFLWANRREHSYASFPPMSDRFDRPAILRWYGLSAKRNMRCGACGDAVKSS